MMHMKRRSSARSQMLVSIGDDAESDTPSKKALETGTIGSVCIAAPGLRRLRQFGNNCGLEDVVCMMTLWRPCCLGVRNANNVFAHAARTSLTCGVTESFRLNETSRTLMTSMSSKPAIDGSSVSLCLLLGAMNTISADFPRSSDRLLLLAHCSIFVISDTHNV